MATRVLQDPRRYLLAVLAVVLMGVVPLMFLFVTLMDKVFGAEFSMGWAVLWVLLGIVIVGLIAGLMTILARATRMSDLEHDAHVRGDDVV